MSFISKSSNVNLSFFSIKNTYYKINDYTHFQTCNNQCQLKNTIKFNFITHAENEKLKKLIKKKIESGAFNLNPAYYEGGEYLKSLGMSNQAEISRVLDIAMNPNTLYFTFSDRKRALNSHARILNVKTDIIPIINFFKEQNVSTENIIKIIVKHPPVLCYNVEDYLRPLFEYLNEIGISDVAQCIINRPSILGLDVNENLKKIVGYLEANDYNQDQIADIIENSI